MSADLGEAMLYVGGGAGGLGVLWKVVSLLAAERLKKAADDETKIEQKQEQETHDLAIDVKQIGAGMTELKADMRVLIERVGADKSERVALKERAEGVFANHGERIARLEESATRHDERLNLVALLDERLGPPRRRTR